ncbi:MAG TPA: Sec-independent protein translocase protein TatB [Pseudomonadales bacterium]|nr:Sec-independent protein translocase protein TatB [Pseudomonadales bacterium]
MFDISFSELALICVIALLVLGPERMPQALRTLGLWIGRASRTFTTMRAEIEREIGMDEIRRQLHNEAVMDQLKRLEREVKGESEPTPNAVAPTSPPAQSQQDHSAVTAPISNGDGKNTVPPQ